jgi:hypothetical protein
VGLATLIPACLLGFVLPGWGLATIAAVPARTCAAFLLSLAILFAGVLALETCGVPISARSVGLSQLAVTALAFALAARGRGWRALVPDAQGTRRALAEALAVRHGRLLAACIVVVGATLAVRCCIQPLSGLDTSWRWDFLARQLLATETLGFYPPRSADDYRMYFFPDAIPPLVSVAYWWLYASSGRAVPELTVILVVAQWACATALAHQLATRLLSREAGMLAAAILASTPLVYRATFMGQETGLTLASFAGVLAFACTWSERARWSAAIVAGVAAGVGALCREYGWAWMPLGVLMLAWRGAGLGPMLALAAAATAVAGPWYLRTWLLTGNPFHPLAVGPFDSATTNPLFAAILELLRERGARSALSATMLGEQASFVLSLAPLAIPAGVAALVWRLRHDWALAVAAAVLIGLWWQSIPYTQGGFRYSTRVLGPAMLVLSVAAATAIARGGRPRRLLAGTAAVCLATAWTLVNALVFPSELGEVAWADVPKVATGRTAFAFQVRESQTLDALRSQLPAGGRILSDNAYAAMAVRGSDWELVPFWSPEFALVFDRSRTADDVDRTLRARGIRGMLIGVGTPETEIYGRYPFFRETGAGWQAVLRLASGYILIVPTDGAR